MKDKAKQPSLWLTGVDTGLGRTLVRELAKMGWQVFGTVFKEENIAVVEAELRNVSETGKIFQQDVRKPEDAARVAKEIAKVTGGTLTALVNNAGVDHRIPVEEMSPDRWREVIGTNLDGVWYTCNEAIPLMKAGNYGKIVHFGSITAEVAFANMAAYESSKLGLIGLTRGLARDLGPFGIRVNTLVLGAIQVVEKEAMHYGSDAILDFVNAHQSIPGRITPEQLAPIVDFFLRPPSDPITGQALPVDLGWAFR